MKIIKQDFLAHLFEKKKNLGHFQLCTINNSIFGARTKKKFYNLCAIMGFNFHARSRYAQFFMITLIVNAFYVYFSNFQNDF